MLIVLQGKYCIIIIYCNNIIIYYFRHIVSNEIQCTSSLASVNCTRTVVVSINQQEFTNTTVQYLYLNDPTFTAVNPTNTIPA